MAPNRKSPTLFANNLESLNIPLKAEFLPLTDPREAEQQQQQQKCVQHDLRSDPKTEKAPITVSYWDFPSDTAEEEKLAAIDDLFSLSRFESNLISDSIRRENSTAHVPVDKSKGSEDQAEEQQSYWDWSNEDVDVVEPETDSQDDKRCQIDDRHCEECCDDYWSWHPKEATEEDCHNESPSDRLHQVVAESRKKFVRRHSHLPEPGDNEISKSHHYWHWLEDRSANAE
mmetsp:Transcript_9313/g.23156  ORF Transcript_9313/g.23156 Transcript_9313/m.23156 type:complete len:229 (+) Transcript_9313:135-821(+)|eukprot:CAMPEP_0116097820 /NCGR_PEP_ID=MMETSP0327-20121206/10905_1 /TAXON_ID=44447 /ORGANISM="Pseudo-nitzschia delicatissima, Strain B596" /LENGTH=228 /DNA_ID=CAMNT_0003589589 /DNA_START=69 /DNA_END=755 /DNA_ORIENTATION=-